MAELATTKRAKEELDSRVAALEAQLQAAAVAKAAADAKNADLVEALEVCPPPARTLGTPIAGSSHTAHTTPDMPVRHACARI